MVGVLSTRLQEVYANWEARTEVRNAESTANRFTLDGNSNFLFFFALNLFLRKLEHQRTVIRVDKDRFLHIIIFLQ